MAIVEEKVIDKIEVLENGTIQVREATRIVKDGSIVAQTFHRWGFIPGSDVSFMPNNVKEIASLVWTEEVISAYNQAAEAENARQQEFLNAMTSSAQ